MTSPKTLETLLERAESWPEEAQAELVQFIIETEGKYFGLYRLSDDEREAIRRGLDEARQGTLASDEQVAAVFDRYRRR